MRALVTINHNHIKIWDRVRLDLQGDCTELNNLQKELVEVKKIVNAEVNRKGLKLKQVEVKIELKKHPKHCKGDRK